MVECSVITWLQNNLSMLNVVKELLLAFIGTGGAILGSIYLFKKQKIHEQRKSHFQRIKTEILLPLSEIPPFGSRRLDTLQEEALYDDLKNHYPEILDLIEKLITTNTNKEEKNIIDLINKEAEDLDLEKYPKNTYHYITDNENTIPEVFGNQVKYKNMALAVGAETQLKRFLERIIKAKQKNNMVQAVKVLNNKKREVAEVRTTFRKKINEAISQEKLKGNCNYLN